MRKHVLMVAAAALVAVPAGAVHAQEAGDTQEASWVHVRVDEADGAKVRVNLPISLVDVALESAGEEALADGRLRLGDESDVTVEEIRRMWRELRDAGDVELVNVQDDEEHVRVFRRGDHVFVHVDEDGEEKVRVEMPVEVADALLAGEGDRLDLKAAVRKMASRGDSELVRVRDTDATVRIWVDSRSDQAEGEETE